MSPDYVRKFMSKHVIWLDHQLQDYLWVGLGRNRCLKFNHSDVAISSVCFVPESFLTPNFLSLNLCSVIWSGIFRISSNCQFLMKIS